MNKKNWSKTDWLIVLLYYFILLVIFGAGIALVFYPIAAILSIIFIDYENLIIYITIGVGVLLDIILVAIDTTKGLRRGNRSLVASKIGFDFVVKSDSSTAKTFKVIDHDEIEQEVDTHTKKLNELHQILQDFCSYSNTTTLTQTILQQSGSRFARCLVS